MLTIKQTTKLTGEIKVGNVTVVNLYADVSEILNGNTTINQTIYNQELYKENIETCRNEIGEFYEKVWEVEDKYILESVKTVE